MAAAEAVEPEESGEVSDATDIGDAGASQQGDADNESTPKPKRRTVPLEEHVALRKRAQEAEAERERLRVETEYLRRERQQSPQHNPQAEVELTDDELWQAGGPAKFINEGKAEARRRAAEAEFNALTRMSRVIAKKNHGDYLEKEAYWRSNAPESVRAAVTAEDDPCEFVYDWAKSKMEPAKSEEEREAEITARVIEKLKAKGVEIPDDEEAETKPRKQTLRSIAGSRSAQRESTQVQNPTAVQMARKAQHGKF